MKASSSNKIKITFDTEEKMDIDIEKEKNFNVFTDPASDPFTVNISKQIMKQKIIPDNVANVIKVANVVNEANNIENNIENNLINNTADNIADNNLNNNPVKKIENNNIGL